MLPFNLPSFFSPTLKAAAEVTYRLVTAAFAKSALIHYLREPKGDTHIF